MVNEETNVIQQDETQNSPAILSARDIASYLRIGYTKALSLMKHELPSLKFGNTYRIARSSFEEWLKRNEAIKAGNNS